MLIVRDCEAWLPLLEFLPFICGPLGAPGWWYPFVSAASLEAVSADSRLRFGITLPSLVCEMSWNFEYDDMDMVRSSPVRSGTTLPCAVNFAIGVM